MRLNAGKQTSKYYKREFVTMTQSVTGIEGNYNFPAGGPRISIFVGNEKRDTVNEIKTRTTCRRHIMNCGFYTPHFPVKTHQSD